MRPCPRYALKIARKKEWLDLWWYLVFWGVWGNKIVRKKKVEYLFLAVGRQSNAKCRNKPHDRFLKLPFLALQKSSKMACCYFSSPVLRRKCLFPITKNTSVKLIYLFTFSVLIHYSLFDVELDVLLNVVLSGNETSAHHLYLFSLLSELWVQSWNPMPLEFCSSS